MKRDNKKKPSVRKKTRSNKTATSISSNQYEKKSRNKKNTTGIQRKNTSSIYKNTKSTTTNYSPTKKYGTKTVNSPYSETNQMQKKSSNVNRHSSSKDINKKIYTNTNIDSNINTRTTKNTRKVKKTSKLISNSRMILSRRNLLIGAIGIGVITAGGLSAKYASNNISKTANNDKILELPESAIVSSSDFNEVPSNTMLVSNKNVQLPYGTLAWANNSDIITCLIPNNTAKPLATVATINVNSLEQKTILPNSVEQSKGFEIYDVRANNIGIIWTEVNILQGEWKIYCSSLRQDQTINPKLIDCGTANWEMPTIGISSHYAYWQINPISDGDFHNYPSFVKKINLNDIKVDEQYFTALINYENDIDNNPNIAITSFGKMPTPIYSCNDGITVTTRNNYKTIYHKLTYLSNSGKIEDNITLPQNMKPLEAGYGDTGFNFSFDSIYSYGDGISNLGTYTPLTKCTEESYNTSQWLGFNRAPTAAPAWSKGYFIVRSSMAICALDFKNNNYCIIDRPNASDDYGDYLASQGNCDKIVTFANILDQTVTGDEVKHCMLRIWEKVN